MTQERACPTCGSDKPEVRGNDYDVDAISATVGPCDNSAFHGGEEPDDIGECQRCNQPIHIGECKPAQKGGALDEARRDQALIMLDLCDAGYPPFEGLFAEYERQEARAAAIREGRETT